MKFLLLIFCCWFAGNQAVAQANISTGFRAGIAYNNLTGDDIANEESLIGFNGGLFLNYSISQRVSLQPELNLSVKGAKEVTINSFPFSKASVSFIQVPVLLQLQSKQEWGKALYPFLSFGPAVNFNFIKDLEGEIIEDVPGAYSVDQDVKDINYEALFGAGVKIQEKYLIDLRYSYGLSDIFENGDVKSESIILSVGFIF